MVLSKRTGSNSTSNKETANELVIGEKTVKTHVSKIPATAGGSGVKGEVCIHSQGLMSPHVRAGIWEDYMTNSDEKQVRDRTNN